MLIWNCASAPIAINKVCFDGGLIQIDQYITLILHGILILHYLRTTMIKLLVLTVIDAALVTPI